MNFLHTEIGSAKDNLKSPIHNWYKFTAGFSHKFVDEIIQLERLRQKPDAVIFDGFAGCGTTLVSAQKAQVNAVGNEGQAFMYDIIRAKLGWSLDANTVANHLAYLQEVVATNLTTTPIVHPLLASLYDEDTLRVVYQLKISLNEFGPESYRLFYKLALSQTLHKVAIHPIAVPYISRSKTLSRKMSAIDTFSATVQAMLTDLSEYRTANTTSHIYLQDSRQPNPAIEDNSCTTCITSPPYLNNLDYGEVSKVHTHFFDITQNWDDITTKVRSKLVTGATTHYRNSDFQLDAYNTNEFSQSNPMVMQDLLPIYNQLTQLSKERGGRKRFDILTLMYFNDMYQVLKEMRRVLKPKSSAYLILGDSAPYGVHVPTTELLGKIALSAGFNKYSIHKIRQRGTKWKSLRYRHSLELSENVLVLKDN